MQHETPLGSFRSCHSGSLLMQLMSSFTSAVFCGRLGTGGILLRMPNESGPSAEGCQKKRTQTDLSDCTPGSHAHSLQMNTHKNGVAPGFSLKRSNLDSIPPGLSAAWIATSSPDHWPGWVEAQVRRSIDAKALKNLRTTISTDAVLQR